MSKGFVGICDHCGRKTVLLLVTIKAIRIDTEQKELKLCDSCEWELDNENTEVHFF